MTHDGGNTRAFRIATVGVAVAALAVYWRTAYPTITWWDSSSYSTAAATMGLTSPPGSLLLTLLGWPLTKLPLGNSPAHVLNMFAGALGALTAVLVFLVARDLRSLAGANPSSHGARVAVAVAAAAGALTFAFGQTLWEYSTRFTPYVLTAVFTGLILWTLLRWWRDAEQPGSWRWLLLLTLLFGLDFSVHRTNALLIPGAMLWILLRDPRIVLNWRAWAAAAGGMVIGLSFHLLVIPIARTTESPLNMFPPTTLAAFWDFVSLESQGGGFRLQFWPRNADVWSVQLADFVRTMRDNFMHARGGPLGPFGLLPAVAGAIGAVALWRRHRRLGLAYLLLLASHAVLTVAYFNIPEAYFRSLDRHYLPVAVTCAVLVVYGMAALAARVSAVQAIRPRTLAFAAGLAAVVPVAQLSTNWRAQDSSQRYFARDYAVNALEALPENAIYFTVGDNDTFPVLYAQAVEKVRPDVRIVNLSIASADWGVEQIRRADPDFPFALTAEEQLGLVGRTGDTTITVPVAGSMSDTLRLRVSPRFGDSFLLSDVVMMDLVSANAWRRPITFASTAGPADWLRDYARLDGLHWVVSPDRAAIDDTTILRTNLFDRYTLRGFADTSVQLDRETVTIAAQYIRAFMALAEADGARCGDVARRLLEVLPPARLRIPGYDETEASARCGSSE